MTSGTLQCERNPFAVVFVALMMTGFAACSRPSARAYALSGTVVSVDKTSAMVTVSHDAVPGLMAAMTMPFKVKDAWVLDVLKPGYKVQAQLIVTGDRSWLQDFNITQSASPNIEPAAMHNPEPGDAVPDFDLVNAFARKITLASFRGKAVALTFIYTRCPLPDYCPLMNVNFQKLDAMLAKDRALYQSTHLLSISFDTAHDTPAVLRSFGSQYAGKAMQDGFAHWDFATAEQAEIKKMSLFFGFNYFEQNDTIVHSLATAVVGPDGRVVKLYRGNDWQPQQIFEDLRTAVSSQERR